MIIRLRGNLGQYYSLFLNLVRMRMMQKLQTRGAYKNDDESPSRGGARQHSRPPHLLLRPSVTPVILLGRSMPLEVDLEPYSKALRSAVRVGCLVEYMQR